MEVRLYCSNCGVVIKDSYYKCLDNCLQANYFDIDEENCFCSKECFCKYLELEEVDIDFGPTGEEKEFAKAIMGNEEI